MIYLLAVMFISLFTTAGAVAQLGRSIALKAVNEEPIWAVTIGESFANYTPLKPDSRTTEIIGLAGNWILPELLEASFVGLLAATIFEFHRRRWRDQLRRESGDG